MKKQKKTNTKSTSPIELKGLRCLTFDCGEALKQVFSSCHFLSATGHKIDKKIDKNFSMNNLIASHGIKFVITDTIMCIDKLLKRYKIEKKI